MQTANAAREARALWENPEARRVLDSMTELFVALDRSYNIVFVNKSLVDLSGKGPDAFLGKNHWDLWPEMRGSIVEESYERAFLTGIPVRFQYLYEKSQVWVDVNAYAIGEHLHIYFRDVTSERTAGEELVTREETFRDLIDAIPHIAWATEPNGAMIYINARWREYTGVDGMDVEKIRAAIHPDDLDRVTEIMVQSRSTGEYVPYDLRLRRHDGEYRWHRVKASPMYAPDGNPIRWIGTSTDVHEEVLAFESLRESDDHHRFRMVASPQVPWLADANGQIYEFSPQWLALTGMTLEEAEVSQIAVLHPDDVQTMIERWSHCLESGKPFDFEHRIRVADGSYRWMRSRATARMGCNGKILRWYGTTEDIHDQRLAGEVLARTRESLDFALKSGRMGWWARDLASGEVIWSAELEALFGLEPGSFHGNENTFLDHIFEEDREEVAEAVRQAIQSRSDFTNEFRFRRPDGSVRWMEGRGRGLYDESGEAISLYGIGIDITERKAAEDAVRESERRLRSLIEQSPIAVQTFDSQGLCLTVNGAWETLWGVDSAEVAGYNVLEDPQLEVRGAMPQIRRAFEGEAQRLAPILYDPAESGYLGRARWIGARIYPVFDTAGAIREVVLLLEDVTARREAFDALRQSEQRFRTIAETVPHFIWAASADGKTEYTNPQLREYLGVAPEQMEPEAWIERIHPEDREHAIGSWTRAQTETAEYELEFRIRRANGEYRWFLVKNVPILNSDGALLRWYGIATDIHERKEQTETLDRLVRERTEELERAYREQESFSYSVSHDLRSPLRAIVASARILEDDFGNALPEDAKNLLQKQANSAKRLANLIDDLLELSRVGRREPSMQNLDISGIFESVAERLARTDSLQFKIERGLSGFGDAQLLELVAQNLLENAAKFSPKGGLVRVGMDRSMPESPFFVSDEGVGFEMEYVHKLFQPFQRLHHDQDFEGTGIGLATVRRIIDRHQGSVWVQSAPGKGTTFYFTLGTSKPLCDE